MSEERGKESQILPFLQDTAGIKDWIDNIYQMLSNIYIYIDSFLKR